MAWTTPITWVDGTRYVAADLNQQIRDNLNALRNGGLAIPGMQANDFIFAATATTLGRLAAEEGSVPVFSGGVWTMQDAGGLLSGGGGGTDASWIIAAESFA